MSDSVRPHRRQPTRLPHPWDSPGKNTGGVAISFSNAWKWKVKVKWFSHVWLLVTPWAAAHQAPLPMGFSRQEYCSGLPLPSPRSCSDQISRSSCLTLCDPMNRSTSGLPVHHQLLEFTQTHVHRVSDAIQPSHPLSSPSPPAPNPSQHQSLSNESTLRMRWPKYWSFSFSIIPSKEIPGLISFRMDWLDLLAVQGTFNSLLQHHGSKASILRCSAFFTVQLSHP